MRVLLISVTIVVLQLLNSIAPGSKHTLSLRIDSDTPDASAFMSYAFQVKHASTLPPSSPKCAITLTTSLSTPSLKIGRFVLSCLESEKFVYDDLTCFRLVP